MTKLVLIDGNAIMHRAYHALPPLTTKEGKPINAVYGLVSILLKIIADLKPTHLVICFDRKEPTFRHIAFKDYQAHRPEMDKDLSSQFAVAKQVVSAFGIPIHERVGYEADDVLGTLARQAQKKVEQVVIVTGDRDILQLVNGKIKVYLPVRGLSEGQLMDRKKVLEQLGVKPEQIADYKALVGDPSDNYPGVKGIGPKTAEKLLRKYGNLENIYKHLDEIDERIATLLKKDKKNAFLSQKLAKIVTDVEVDFDLKKASSWQIDSQKALDLLAGFGFKTLTKRVKKVGEKIEKEKQMKLI